MIIGLVQGTRPEIIKNYSIVKALAAQGIAFQVFHTNQHSAHLMCGQIYQDMGYLPSRVLEPEYSLGLAIDWLQKNFVQDRITHVIVNGDTAAALAGALAAMYSDIDVSHVEAGLRSGDSLMKEERNRIMVDSIASELFAYTSHERSLLQGTQGIRGQIYLEGNTTVDVLHDFTPSLAARPSFSRYVYVTLHRKEFTDSRERMEKVFAALRHVAQNISTVVFPMHPRTRDAIRRRGIPNEALAGVEVIDPVSLTESLRLQKHSLAILTDSGCVQEEAYLLGVPCVTVRENTERHLTVLNGANVLTGFSMARIVAAVERALQTSELEWPEIYGNNGVGRRIVTRILEDCEKITHATAFAVG
jgi:UDP-N-acetylglucosamine 2-epimerase